MFIVLFKHKKKLQQFLRRQDARSAGPLSPSAGHCIQAYEIADGHAAVYTRPVPGSRSCYELHYARGEDARAVMEEWERSVGSPADIEPALG